MWASDLNLLVKQFARFYKRSNQVAIFETCLVANSRVDVYGPRMNLANCTSNVRWREAAGQDDRR